MLGTRMGEGMKYQKDTKSPKWTFDERTATTESQLKPVNLNTPQAVVCGTLTVVLLHYWLRHERNYFARVSD